MYMGCAQQHSILSPSFLLFAAQNEKHPIPCCSSRLPLHFFFLTLVVIIIASFVLCALSLSSFIHPRQRTNSSPSTSSLHQLGSYKIGINGGVEWREQIVDYGHYKYITRVESIRGHIAIESFQLQFSFFSSLTFKSFLFGNKDSCYWFILLHTMKSFQFWHCTTSF